VVGSFQWTSEQQPGSFDRPATVSLRTDLGYMAWQCLRATEIATRLYPEELLSGNVSL